ncbi:hypothetical protein OG301_31085 [Streptomyces platensis]|nr:hypothetical protein OG229_07685 [Streptomyces platensis]WTI55444.1 hypothetical protein OG301_31085 [Streptomyces platensis]WUB78975.1 hypothetical protein OG424_07165 [Streptomyces platensis]
MRAVAGAWNHGEPPKQEAYKAVAVATQMLVHHPQLTRYAARESSPK